MTQVVRALTSWRVFPGEKLLRKGREWIFAMGALGWNVKISQNSWTVCFKRLKMDEDSKKREGNLLVMAVTACCSLRGKLLHLCVSLFWHSCWCQEENDTLLAQRRISGFWPRNLTAALYYPASKQISFDLVFATQYLLLGACCHLLSPVHWHFTRQGEPRVLSKRPILGFDHHLVGNCLGDECTRGLPDAVLQDKDCRRLLKAWLGMCVCVCWSIFLPFFHRFPSVPQVVGQGRCGKHLTANPEEIFDVNGT